MKHYLHSLVEKNILEELIQYLKDSIESFDHYYPSMQKEFNLFHVYYWIQFFISKYSYIIANNNYDY
ncbi:MAG: hypothetical protein MRJ93_11205 [Nitrososphaeraceae archaeon]|nr:hypothetical protein [Nitrososphaeraceae archaeon]